MSNNLDFRSKLELVKADAMKSTGPGQFSLPSIEANADTRAGSGPYYDQSLMSTSTSSPLGRHDGILSYEMMRLIARRSSVVRPAIDFIVRAISTTPYRIKALPGVRVPKKAIKQAEALLIDPMGDIGAETFSHLLSKLIRDIITLDHGILLKQRDKGALNVIEVMDAPTFSPNPGPNGRLKDWSQKVNSTDTKQHPRSDVIHFVMNPRSDSLYGEPAMESVIHEINATLNASKSLSSAFDRNEIPPGILFLLGVNDQTALTRFQRELKRTAKLGQNEYALRTLSGMDDAKWINFQKEFREMQVAELTTQLQRTVWRAFGVDRLAMSDIDDVNRSSAYALVMTRNYTLFKPLLDMLADKITYQLLREIHEGLYIEFVHYARTGETTELITASVNPSGIDELPPSTTGGPSATSGTAPATGKACGGCRGRAHYDFTVNGATERIPCPDCDGTGINGPLFVSRPQRTLIPEIMQQERVYRRNPTEAWDEMATSEARGSLESAIERCTEDIDMAFGSVSTCEDLSRAITSTRSNITALFKTAYTISAGNLPEKSVPSSEVKTSGMLDLNEFIRFSANPKLIAARTSQDAGAAAFDLHLDAIALCKKAKVIAGRTLIESIHV